MSQPLRAAEAALRDFLDDLVRRGVVPGGAAAVVGPEGPRWSAHFGRRALVPEAEEATPDTLWDLASLTKPLVTASLWLRLRARGEADFGEPVTELVPELAGEHRAPTIGELLTHSGGLPAWEPLYLRAGGGLPGRAAWLGAHREAPGLRAVYGCPGYQVLGLALERRGGRSLPELAGAELWPAREGLHFPLPAERAGEAAPTETGNAFERGLAARTAGEELAAAWPHWRTGLLRGEVHDVNAWSLGGAAGNAGLFASLDGAAFLAARFLRPGFLGERDLGELAADQVAPAARGEGSERRSWGFQLARSENSCAGEALSERAFGHAGFTGTSLFVDPARDAAFLLLTNRVHPEHRGHAFHAERRRFHELAAALGEALVG